jgi:hypothetical protein
MSVDTSRTIRDGEPVPGGMSDHRPRRRPRQKNLSGVERELIKSKTENRDVRVTLAIETDYTDNEGGFMGRVEWVEPGSVKFEIDGEPVWVFRAFIVSVQPR